MSQPVTSSRLTNSAVNIIGATTAVNTNFGLNKIGVTGNSFDISSSSGTVTLGITGTGNVQIGNGTSGTVTFPGATTFTQPVNGGVFTGTASNGTAATTALTIGSNLTTGSVTIGAQSANTVTIGANSIGATGTVNVGTGSANINIGSTAASAIVLGRTGGSVTLGPPLTLGAAPTTSGQLGHIKQLSLGSTYAVPNSSNVANPFGATISLEPGVYSMTHQYQFKAATGTASVITSIFISSFLTTGAFYIGTYGLNPTNQTVSNTTNNNYTLNMSCVFSTSVSNTLTPEMFVTYTGGNLNLIVNNTFFTVVRIG